MGARLPGSPTSTPRPRQTTPGRPARGDGLLCLVDGRGLLKVTLVAEIMSVQSCMWMNSGPSLPASGATVQCSGLTMFRSRHGSMSGHCPAHQVPLPSSLLLGQQVAASDCR